MLRYVLIAFFLAGSFLAAVHATPEKELVLIKGVPHVEQKPDYCGEACGEMVLRKLGYDADQDYVFKMSGLDPELGRGCYTRDLKKALEFYKKVIDADCDRPFINRDAYFKMARILFEQARFKEALVSFVSVLSFDRDDKEIISHIEDCLKRLGIMEHRDKFLRATPNEARKLIMEVL